MSILKPILPTVELRIAVAFFLSGIAALIYQIVWQRVLFASVGVDIESVTIVVSVFMLGLGLGAVIGGRLADSFPVKIIYFFLSIEILIGLFGFFSVDLILWLKQPLSEAPRLAFASLSFVLLLPATVCMGATLPMLVANDFRRSLNIGVSTGFLYSINTLGAALGAAAVGFLLFYWMDLRQIVILHLVSMF